MSRLDRQLQLKLLTLMRDCYPSRAHRLPPDIRGRDKDFVFNVTYLQEHGLCVAEIQESLDSNFSWGGARITAKGIDFLEDDGGLFAILSVVTVKLEADTVKQLLSGKIDETTLPPTRK